ncbi:MAG: glycoside hydrolase family 26 protein [Phycisphaerae bacterium]
MAFAKPTHVAAPLVAVLGLSLWALAGGRAGDRSTDSTPASRKTNHPQWGLYQIYWGPRIFESILRREVATFATPPDYVMFYRDLGRPFPAEGIAPIRAVGATPIISLELWHWHDHRRKCLPAIVAGDYDRQLERWASQAKQDGQRVLLRFGFEANGDWFSWGGDPTTYVQAWRRAHDIFTRAGADNVEWVWSPNAVSIPRTPANSLHHYYPGGAYVDWVALDGYNWGPDHDQWHHWESFDEVFGPALKLFAERYPEKPIMIAETGCVIGPEGAKAAWIRDAYRAVADHPKIKALIWFNYDKRGEGEPDWRINTSTDTLEAFNKTFAAPGPDGPPPPDPKPASR